MWDGPTTGVIPKQSYVLPILVCQGSSLQLFAMQTPLRHELIHERLEAIVVVTF